MRTMMTTLMIVRMRVKMWMIMPFQNCVWNRTIFKCTIYTMLVYLMGSQWCRHRQRHWWRQRRGWRKHQFHRQVAVAEVTAAVAVVVLVATVVVVASDTLAAVAVAAEVAAVWAVVTELTCGALGTDKIPTPYIKSRESQRETQLSVMTFILGVTGFLSVTPKFYLPT